VKMERKCGKQMRSNDAVCPGEIRGACHIVGRILYSGPARGVIQFLELAQRPCRMIRVCSRQLQAIPCDPAG
jgi:hypothetical protein